MPVMQLVYNFIGLFTPWKRLYVHFHKNWHKLVATLLQGCYNLECSYGYVLMYTYKIMIILLCTCVDMYYVTYTLQMYVHRNFNNYAFIIGLKTTKWYVM